MPNVKEEKNILIIGCSLLLMVVAIFMFMNLKYQISETNKRIFAIEKYVSTIGNSIFEGGITQEGEAWYMTLSDYLKNREQKVKSGVEQRLAEIK